MPGGFLSGMAPLCFIAAGTLSRIVSCPTCLHCVSYRQETFREWFPIRHGSIAFHTDRKLFANGFLSGMAPLRFISTGNFSPIVSCPTWLHCVSSRQETFRVQFPIRHDAIVFHRGRKLFDRRFLDSARNDRTAWLHCVSYRQETFRKWFPLRHGAIAFHTNRKLFANGFQSGMTPLCFIAAGNYSHIISCPAWLHCVSYRQETFRPEISRLRFAPLEMTERHVAIAFHLHRKLSPIRV